MSLVENERTKLLANALDRASTACVTVGLLAPIAAVIYGASGTAVTPWTFALGGVIWLLAGCPTFGGKVRPWRTEIMSFIEIFAFLVMPAAVVAIGWGGAWLHMRELRHRHGHHPAE